MMKSIVFASAAVVGMVAVSSGASAAGGAVQSWKGWYAGADVGFGAIDGDTSFNPLPSAAYFDDLKPTSLELEDGGMNGAVHAGVNWQSGRVVYGAEADFSISGVESSKKQSPIIEMNGSPFASAVFGETPYTQLYTAQENLWMGSLRGRIGVIPFDKFLVYGTAGLALGENKFKAVTAYTNCTGCYTYTANFNEVSLGWVLGGGLEYALAGGWSIRGEYLHYDLSDVSRTANPTPSRPNYKVRYEFDTAEDVGRIGVSYKFYSYAPVSAYSRY